ncbi:MAG: HDOD domain-containing protein [Deltaproteobacteria bacterium]|nr:HDOD domain-containing protein [Deltaproteobacteria bacterium]
MDTAKLATRLEEILLKKLDDGKLVLPTMPKVALALRSRLDDESTADLRALSALLEEDPLLATRVLQLANSAMYRSRDEIKALGHAVTRLGIRKLREVLYAATAQQVYTSRQPQLSQVMNSLWDHSLVVARLARDIHGISGASDSEPAFLAGLLHDVGKAIAAVHLVEVERDLPTDKARSWIGREEFTDALNRVNRPLGAALAQKWDLPAIVTQAVKGSDDYDSSDRQSVVNAVRFANALAKKHGFAVGVVNEEEIGAQIMIGCSVLGIDQTVVDELIKKLEAQHRTAR